jgi:hypothetical protein
MPDEVKKNISKGRTGVRPSKEICEQMSKSRSGKGHWNYGNITPAEVSKKISEGVTKRNKEKVLDLKEYTLLDTYTNETISFNTQTFNEKISPLGISRSGLFWAVRYNLNKLYKNRFTLVY